MGSYTEIENREVRGWEGVEDRGGDGGYCMGGCGAGMKKVR